MKNKLSLLFTFIIFTISTYGQGDEEVLPLTKIISDLSGKYSIQFSYADQDINDLYITQWNNNLSLSRSLKVLSNNFSLTFEKINEKTFAISKNQKAYMICGSLKDLGGNPIPNVIIRLAKVVTKSNEDGLFYILTTKKNEQLNISQSGYETMSVSVKDILDKECAEILLINKDAFPVELEEVLLKNYITAGISKNRKGYIEINYKDFGILPGLIESDVLLSAQSLPGVISVNERVSNLNIRGGTNDQNLLLWDGIKMYQSGHFFGLISAFNPETTKKASIYTNGTNAKYADGVSGTIVMETNNEIADKIKGSAGLNLLNANLNIEVPISKRSSLQVAGRHSLNGIYETPTYDSYFDQAFRDTEVIGNFDSSIISNRTFNFFDTSVRYFSNLSDKTFIKANSIFISNELEFTENGSIDDEVIMTLSGVSQRNLAGGIILGHKWNNKHSSELQTYITNYSLQSENTNFTRNQVLIQENDVLEASARLESSFKLNNDFLIKGGYQFTETGIRNLADVTNPSFRSDIKEVVITNALYLEGDKRFLDGKGRAILGLRANHFGKLDTIIIEPRAVFNYKILKGFTAEIKGEYKSQITSQIINLQNDFIGVDNRRWILSNNETIPVITGRQVSLGLHYSKRDLLISTEYYVKRVNGITTQSQGFLNQLQFANNIGVYNIQGVDLLISKNFGDFNTSLSYSFSNNNYSWDVLPNNIIRNFPNNNDVRHSLNGIFDYTYKKIKVAASVNWRTGKPFTPLDNTSPVIDNELNFDTPNSSNIDNYLRVDLSATYNFNFDENYKGFVGLSLWNITNEINELERTFINMDNTPSTFRRRALERTPNVSFKLSF